MKAYIINTPTIDSAMSIMFLLVVLTEKVIFTTYSKPKTQILFTFDPEKEIIFDETPIVDDSFKASIKAFVSILKTDNLLSIRNALVNLIDQTSMDENTQAILQQIEIY